MVRRRKYIVRVDSTRLKDADASTGEGWPEAQLKEDWSLRHRDSSAELSSDDGLVYPGPMG